MLWHQCTYDMATLEIHPITCACASCVGISMSVHDHAGTEHPIHVLCIMTGHQCVSCATLERYRWLSTCVPQATWDLRGAMPHHGCQAHVGCVLLMRAVPSITLPVPQVQWATRTHAHCTGAAGVQRQHHDTPRSCAKPATFCAGTCLVRQSAIILSVPTQCSWMSPRATC